MLTETPVSGVSLNELSRRVGLAKSNVLRYFESREAVLLELLDRAWKDWLLAFSGELAHAIDADAEPEVRAARLAAVLASSLTDRPLLCELLSAQAAVLEHNVSAGVAARYKRATIGDVARLAEMIGAALPELRPGQPAQVAAAIILITGALRSHARPSEGMRAAYAADPELAKLRIDFTAVLRDTVELLFAGALQRAVAC